MKVLLISINNCGMPFNVYPLGMSIVANILDLNGYNVKQLDLLVEKFSYKNLQFEIESFKPDIVGISIRNIYIDTIPMCKKIVNICHKNKISVFLGGSGFYHAHLKIMESTGADFGLLGPAESNLLDFVHDFQKNKLEKHTVIKPKQYHTIAGPLYEENILKYYSKTPLSIGINTKR
ncbi:MAG: cobalamin B12-binding domain-containing protein [Endomicrobiaceae bacterium]|nr:cobalamin B12-binding domain-containing protein [Endomicrobiaceae bacterium]